MDKLYRVVASRPFFYLAIVVSVVFILCPYIEFWPFGTWAISNRRTLSILGLSVLPSLMVGHILGASFSRQLAEDAFRASVGYLLPEYLRSELQWIYEQKIIAIQTEIGVDLKLERPGVVRVTTETRRYFKNCSGSTVKGWRLNFFVDEWGFVDLKSQIIEWTCNYRKTPIRFSNTGTKTELSPFRLKVTGFPSIDIEPNEEVVITSKTVEYKSTNDGIHVVFGNVSHRPTVIVHHDPSHLQIAVGLGHREGAVPIGINTYQLQGVQLPGQAITIRWAPATGQKEAGLVK